MYNRSAQFWHALYNIFSQYKLIRGRQWMHFFGSQQRFFRQMLMAAKVLSVHLALLSGTKLPVHVELTKASSFVTHMSRQPGLQQLPARSYAGRDHTTSMAGHQRALLGSSEAELT